MYKPTKSLLLAALMGLAPAAYAQAQLPTALTDGVQTADPNGTIFTNVVNLDTTMPMIGGAVAFGDSTGATLSQINVNDGGLLSSSNETFDFTEINIFSGGDTTNSVDFESAEVNVLPGGTLGSSFEIEATSTLNASAGSTIESNGDILGTANINGATVIGNFDSEPGSTVNIGPGSTLVTSASSNDFNGTVNITGGTLGNSTDFNEESIVTVTGGDFGTSIEFFGQTSINGGTFGSGVDIEASATGLGGGNPVIEDGTFGGTVEFFTATTINGGDFGDSFDFDSGAGNTNIGESIINGGTFGNSGDIFDHNVTINGGTFGTNLDVGNVADDFQTDGISPNVTINDGTFLELDVDSGTVDIFGGTFVGGPTGVALSIAARGDEETVGTVNLHGGDIQGFVEAFGNLNLFGTDFAIDGESIDGLSEIDVFGNRGTNSVLTGTLEDGSAISLDLIQGFFFINGDGETTVFTDVDEGLDVFGLNAPGQGGTLTVNGTVINVVPEPSSLSLLAFGALGLISRRRRS